MHSVSVHRKMQSGEVYITFAVFGKFNDTSSLFGLMELESLRSNEF